MINQSNRGVTLPATQLAPRGEGKPNTLINAAPCEFIGVEYFDDTGARRQTTVMRMGQHISVPPNSEAWTRDLRGAPKWLKEAVLDKLGASAPAEPPKKDDVDIMSGTAPTEEA